MAKIFGLRGMPKDASSRTNGERGFTLVEVAIAALLLALVSVGIFTSMLHIKTTDANLDPKKAALQNVQNLNAALKQFVGVQVDPAHPDVFCNRLCGVNCGQIGANGSLCDVRLAGDTCQHAFTTGCLHNADSVLPATFTAAPLSGHLCYTVTAEPVKGQILSKVVTKIAWGGTLCAIP